MFMITFNKYDTEMYLVAFYGIIHGLITNFMVEYVEQQKKLFFIIALFSLFTIPFFLWVINFPDKRIYQSVYYVSFFTGILILPQTGIYNWVYSIIIQMLEIHITLYITYYTIMHFIHIICIFIVDTFIKALSILLVIFTLGVILYIILSYGRNIINDNDEKQIVHSKETDKLDNDILYHYYRDYIVSLVLVSQFTSLPLSSVNNVFHSNHK